MVSDFKGVIRYYSCLLKSLGWPKGKAVDFEFKN